MREKVKKEVRLKNPSKISIRHQTRTILMQEQKARVLQKKVGAVEKEVTTKWCQILKVGASFEKCSGDK